MANSIELAKLYVANLMKIWKLDSLSAILENDALVQTFVGASANEVKLPSMSMDGLGDYDRANGYAHGDVALTWVTRQLTMDRSQSFNIDSMDDLEAMQVPMGNLLAEFMRTKVIPELDAYRFAKIAQGAVAGNRANGTLSTGDDVLSAINAGIVALDNEEVPREGRVLFCTPAVLQLLKDKVGANRFYTSQDANIGRDITMFDGMQVVVVPQQRFYLGWQKAEHGFINEGSRINFMIVAKEAVIPVVKHNPARIWTPAENQDADGYKIAYRIYHDCFLKPNKESGIYIHTIESFTPETVDTPKITVEDNKTASVKFTVATPTAGASLYYTTDGSTPTSASSAYSSKVTLTDSSVPATQTVKKTVKVIAIKEGMLSSEIASKEVEIVGSGT